MGVEMALLNGRNWVFIWARLEIKSQRHDRNEAYSVWPNR